MLLASDKHYFYRSPADSLLSHSETGYPSYREGKEYRTEIRDVDSARTVMQAQEQDWGQDSPPSWWTGTQESAPANNPHLVEARALLKQTGTSTMLVSKQGFAYDLFNNVTDKYEYDFGAGAAGGLLRHTHMDYLRIHPSSGVDYSGYNLSNPAKSIHIRNLPVTTLVNSSYGDNTSFSAKTEYEYDNYTADGNHAVLTDRAAATGYDYSRFGVSRLTRGNVTAVRQWKNATEVISSYQQYDIAGNVVRSIDPQ